jgi:hypothetical protein
LVWFLNRGFGLVSTGFGPWFQNSQTKTRTMEQGLVWFGFGLNHGLPTFCHQEVWAHIVEDF